MRKQLYLDIKNRIKSIKNGYGDPAFQYFDLWNQQVDFIEEETPFVCPAVFVEFGEMPWRSQGKGVQDCDLKVRIHVVTEWFAGTADNSPTEEDALSYLDLPDLLVANLHNFRTTFTNGLVRTRSVINHNHERYVDSVEEFECNLVDTSATIEHRSVSLE